MAFSSILLSGFHHLDEEFYLTISTSLIVEYIQVSTLKEQKVSLDCNQERQRRRLATSEVHERGKFWWKGFKSRKFMVVMIA